MRTAIILGSGSDIGREIASRLRNNDWLVSGYRHDEPFTPTQWDLIICCYGTLDPIGSFWQADPWRWEEAFRVNLFQPLHQIRALYPHRNPGASVCLFSGAGANGTAPTYSAYCASKVALTKMTELMDDESPDCKFFILGPGMMRTKIQQQTMAAGPRAANLGRVREFLLSGDPGTSHDRVYEFLMACVAAPKHVVGGRNFYVPLDQAAQFPLLADDSDALKLRRGNNELLR